MEAFHSDHLHGHIPALRAAAALEADALLARLSPPHAAGAVVDAGEVLRRYVGDALSRVLFGETDPAFLAACAEQEEQCVRRARRGRWWRVIEAFTGGARAAHLAVNDFVSERICEVRGPAPAGPLGSALGILRARPIAQQ